MRTGASSVVRSNSYLAATRSKWPPTVTGTSPRCLCQRPSPARHAQFTHCSPARQARNPQQANPGHACGHAGHPRARRSGVIAASDLRGNCRGWSSPAEAKARGPHLPGLAGCDMEMGLWRPARGNAILAAAAWRCLDHLACSLCRGVV